MSIATEQLQSFVVAMAVEKMRQSWRNGLGESGDQCLDTFGNVAQTFDVLIGIMPARFIGNNC